MPISPGTRLGVYEITSLIGAGGMGEVYRARDMRLNRDVAIKVLPPGLTPSAEQLARFDREAQTLAALNHSNLAHVYGVEEYVADTGAPARALVMEVVEGEDLSQRLRQGPLAVNDAIAIAVQIAGGLSAAHEQGIIHRDLKPANIKVRPDGTVKILDFGLAKALDRPGQQTASPENSPTITTPGYMTGHGIVLGTAAYMSPEQARGRPVDKRADIWAFGAVVYEMLAGTRAFSGDTISDTVAAVLKSEPDWTLLPSATPDLVRRVLMKCLRKDPRERLADIHDVRIDLEDAFSGPSNAAADRSQLQPRYAPWVVVSALLLAITALGIIATREWNNRRAASTAVVRSSIVLADQDRLFGDPAISPDGRSVVYSLEPGRGLWVRRLDETTSRLLAGTEGAIRPFWSPDGSRIGYYSKARLRSIQIASGVTRDITAIPSFFGGSWNADDVIIFGLQGSGGLHRVSAGGGDATPLTQVDTSEIAHRWPFFLPGGQQFGYVSQRDDGSRLMVAPLSGGAATAVAPVDSSVTFVPPDILLIVRGGDLFAHRFNVANRTLSADGVRIAEGVGVLPSRETSVSAAAGGALVYLPPRSVPKGRLAWVDRAGHASYLPLPEDSYGEPALSPDGSKIALSIREPGGAELWLYEVDRGAFGRRTFNGASTFGVWSPDGRRLTFTRAVAQSGPLMEMSADGSGQPVVVVSSAEHPGLKTASSWSPDGRDMLFRLAGDVMIRHADGSIEPLIATAAIEDEGRFSPDGRFVAYRSNETGSSNVFVQSFPPGRGKWQISASGGAQPMWAPNGRELFFTSGNRMMAVPLTMEPAFKPGVPRMLFEIPMPERTPGDPSRYGVTPDGKRFLIFTAQGSASPPQAPVIHVVTNWRSLLEQPRQ